MVALVTPNFLAKTLNLHAPITLGECHLSNGVVVNTLARGIIEVIPSASMPAQVPRAMVISAGIHGNETAPIELLNLLVNQILAMTITPCCRLLFVIANPTAILAARRFIDCDLNRLFTDNLMQSANRAQAQDDDRLETRLAVQLQQHLHGFFQSLAPHTPCWHFDLHSTIRASMHRQFAIVPSSIDKTNHRALVQCCQASKLDALLFANTPSYTFSWWSAAYYGALAMTVEIGRVAPLYRNDLGGYRALQQHLTKMVADPDWQPLANTSTEQTSANSHALVQYQVTRTLYKQDERFRFKVAGLKNFMHFAEGELIATDGSTEYRAAQGGETIVFPNEQVAISQRAALLVTAQNR